GNRGLGNRVSAWAHSISPSRRFTGRDRATGPSIRVYRAERRSVFGGICSVWLGGHYSMIYDFATQLARGQEHERKLDAIFASEYDISPVGMDKQRMGIDRRYVRKSDRREFWVESK